MDQQKKGTADPGTTPTSSAGGAQDTGLVVPTTRSTLIGERQYASVSQKLIMNQDLNAAGRLFGGRLLEWVDEAAALFAMAKMQTRHIVTKKISEVIFNEPAHLGDVVEILLAVKTSGRTSLTLDCLVMTKIIRSDDSRRLIVRCDLVFVAIDRNGHPTPHAYKPQDEAQAP